MKDKIQERVDGKRTDVGYKRPPPEHQFKAGQKPPARKKRDQSPENAVDCFMRLMAEERRLTKDGKVVWMTNAALLVEVAFGLAERGNNSVSRALADYVTAGGRPDAESTGPKILFDPEGESGIFTHTIRRKV